jgi:hypothetical protein
MIHILIDIHNGSILIVEILKLHILLLKVSKKMIAFIIMAWKYVFFKKENGLEAPLKFHMKKVKLRGMISISPINLLILSCLLTFHIPFHILTQI